MVKYDNKFLSLFIALMDPKVDFYKMKHANNSIKPQMRRLQSALQGDVEFQCLDCLMCYYKRHDL